MDRSDRIIRLILPVAFAVAFAFVWAVRATGHTALYDSIISGWGVVPFDFPFLDIHGVVASSACWHEGVNVYVVNPCDVLGRLFQYSPLLLTVVPKMPGLAATPYAGLLVNGVFMLSLLLLPMPRRAADIALMVLALLSSAIAFGAERANIDLVIFAAAAVIAVLMQRATIARLAAYAMIAAVALVKYYPATLFLLAVRERPKRFVAVATVAVVLAALFVAIYHTDLALAFGHLPAPRYFTDQFSSRNLPDGLGAIDPGINPAFVGVPLVLCTLLGSLALAGRAQAAWRHLPQREATFLTVGAVLLVGCFFAGQNIAYRGVFLLLVLPGLMILARSAAGFTGRIFGATAGVAVCLMWGELFRVAILVGLPRAAFV
ncbi:MAG: glycosyltransferase 87 family protein, partial [Stellaceae bacterium]